MHLLSASAAQHTHGSSTCVDVMPVHVAGNASALLASTVMMAEPDGKKNKGAWQMFFPGTKMHDFVCWLVDGGALLSTDGRYYKNEEVQYVVEASRQIPSSTTRTLSVTVWDVQSQKRRHLAFWRSPLLELETMD